MMTSTTGPRFAGLQAALAKVSRSSGRLGSTKGPAATSVIPVAKAAPAPAQRAASAPAKPVGIVIPPDVAAMGPDAVAAYKRGYARTEARLAELNGHPAVAGRSREALAMLSAGKTNAEIIAELTKGARAKAADAVWDRARTAIYGSSTATAGDDAPDRKAKSSPADDVWDRAWASVNGTQHSAQPDSTQKGQQ